MRFTEISTINKEKTDLLLQLCLREEELDIIKQLISQDDGEDKNTTHELKQTYKEYIQHIEDLEKKLYLARLK